MREQAQANWKNRLAAKYRTVQSGCWEWIEHIDSWGYGKVRYRGQRGYPAHRAVYQEHKGPIPAGKHLDHLCRNPACVNPEHLQPVTPAENAMRAILHRRPNFWTECPQGHEYTPENTYVAPSGARTCRTCNRAAAARRRSREELDAQAAAARNAARLIGRTGQI